MCKYLPLSPPLPFTQRLCSVVVAPPFSGSIPGAGFFRISTGRATVHDNGVSPNPFFLAAVVPNLTAPAGLAQIVSTGELAKRELAEMKVVAGEESNGKGAAGRVVAGVVGVRLACRRRSRRRCCRRCCFCVGKPL